MFNLTKCIYYFPVIDCRLPLEVFNGMYRLLNKTTFFNSVVSYECDPNYVLVGNRSRVCTEFGTWSHSDPSCECKFILVLHCSHCLKNLLLIIYFLKIYLSISDQLWYSKTIDRRQIFRQLVHN